MTSSPLAEMQALRDRLILELDAIDPAQCAPPRTWVTFKKSKGKLVKRWETGKVINGKKQVKEELFKGDETTLVQWRKMERDRDRRAELMVTIDELTARIERLQDLFPEWVS